MALYIVLSKLTDAGAEMLKQKPTRLFDLNKQLEPMGAKVVAQYAVLGEYDFVNIIEAPDAVTMARLSVELGSRGTIRTQTMAALPIEEFVASLTHKS